MVTIITDALIGVVKLIPLKKDKILITMATIESNATFGKSFFSNSDDFIIKEVIQNNIVAAQILTQTKA